MPIDSSIPLGAQGVGPLVNPLQMVQQVEQMKAQRENAAALAEQRQAIAEQRTAQTAKLQRDAEREAQGQAAVDDLFTSYQPGQPIPTAKVGQLYRTIGPEKGSAIIKGLMDFSNADLTSQDAVRKSMLTRISAVKAMPAARQEAAYNAITQDYVQRKIFKPEEVAPYSPEQLDTYERMLLSPEKQYDINHPKPMDVGGRVVAPQADGSVKVLLDKAPEHSPAYKEWQDATATGYKGSFTQYQDADANRKKPVVNVNGMGAFNAQTDPKAIAEGIKNGTLPPQLTEYGRGVQGAVATELSKGGFNLAQAATDWKATQKHVQTMNGAQQLRLNQSINALPDLLDSVDTLAGQWKANAHLPMLNKANLAAAKSGLYGQESASLANQLETQIADVVGDLGTVYMGGNSPTDHGLKLAETALKGEWDAKVIHDMVTLAKKNVVIRRNSITNTGVAGASDRNPYAGGGQGGSNEAKNDNAKDPLGIR